MLDNEHLVAESLTTGDQRIERVAKAICESTGLIWEDQDNFMRSGNGDENGKDYFRFLAAAAIEALGSPVASETSNERELSQ